MKRSNRPYDSGKAKEKRDERFNNAYHTASDCDTHIHQHSSLTHFLQVVCNTGRLPPP